MIDTLIELTDLVAAKFPIDGIDSEGRVCWAGASAQQLAAAQAYKSSLTVIPRRPKAANVLRSEIEALTASDREKLLIAIAVEFLRNNPKFAVNLGLPVEGDEPDPTL